MADNSIHSMRATMVAGAMAKLETRPLGDRDQICHNEATWYPPLTPTDHAMPAYTVAHQYSGPGLGETWSSPGQTQRLRSQLPSRGIVYVGQRRGLPRPPLPPAGPPRATQTARDESHPARNPTNQTTWLLFSPFPRTSS